MMDRTASRGTGSVCRLALRVVRRCVLLVAARRGCRSLVAHAVSSRVDAGSSLGGFFFFAEVGSGGAESAAARGGTWQPGPLWRKVWCVHAGGVVTLQLMMHDPST